MSTKHKHSSDSDSFTVVNSDRCCVVDGLVIDKDDYSVLEPILQQWGTTLRQIKQLSHEDVRVLTLRCPPDIQSLPPSIGRLQNIQELDLSGNDQLRSLPNEIGNLRNLTTLDLSGSRITSLPSSIGQLQKLECLDLR
mmetsp:Transcript_19957/g.41108  ORF Transcript_19957/g.41108 Transcript_19957/m.41108 type:complete len:138 (+) Transcript_19957:157-570(+)